jgi:hypothetical protein
MKRLGYLSLTGSVDSKYQFDVDELENIHPQIIDVFTKIGLLIGNTQRSIGEQTIKKYQFAHRTLQEYFAAMFIVKWEDEWIRHGIKYEKVEKVNELWMWKEKYRSLRYVHMRPKVDSRLSFFLYVNSTFLHELN